MSRHEPDGRTERDYLVGEIRDGDVGEPSRQVWDEPDGEKRKRAKDLCENAQRALDAAIRTTEERGDLRHLHGKPLDLSDDSPGWLANRMLKQAGFSHPLLESRKDVDSAAEDAEEPVRRLEDRRDSLLAQPGGYTESQAIAFNRAREDVLEEYRRRLEALNRSIRDFNLTAPDTLHLVPVRIDDRLSRAAGEVPPLDPPPDPPPPSPSRVVRMWRRLQRH